MVAHAHKNASFSSSLTRFLTATEVGSKPIEFFYNDKGVSNETPFLYYKLHQRNTMPSISVLASTYGRKPVYARQNTKASGILTRFFSTYVQSKLIVFGSFL